MVAQAGECGFHEKCTIIERRQSIVFSLSVCFVETDGFCNGRRRSAISCCQYLDQGRLHVAERMLCDHLVTRHHVVAIRT